MKNKISNNSRRNFLAGSATIAGLAAASTVFPGSIVHANHAEDKAKDLPDFAKWKKRSTLIVHSKSGLETHREDIGSSVITTIRHIYVRNNLPTLTDAQIGKKENWTINIEGVKNPRTFSLKELKSLGFTTVATVLQCSGNGRGYFKHGPSGSQWKTGAAACVVWAGIPVSDIVDICGGLASDVKFMTGTGGDLPKGQDPKNSLMERSVPLKVHKDAILAWEMNGVDLPNVHGAPLRLVTPGYFGVNNIKHINKLSFTKSESGVKFMKSSYRVSPIGKKGSSYPTCWEMPVKSWIVKPNDDSGKIATGNVVITGVAFGGTEALSKVEISIDFGKNWKTAKLVGPDLGKFAWRQFVLELDLKPGTYNLASRAYAGGQSQPELRMENRRAYSHNGWKDHSVMIDVG